MIKKILSNKIMIVVLVPIISTIIGLTLMSLAFLIPTERIYRNVNQSLPILLREGNYFSVTSGIQDSVLDNYTEAIYLNEALVGIKDANLLKCILSGYTFIVSDNDQLLEVNKLAEVFDNSSAARLSSRHYRFFNGYEVILKPLLFLTDYSNIRQINIFGVFLVLYLLCILLHKRGLDKYILPIIISILFINPLTISLSLTFVGFYYCMIIPCVVMLLMKKENLKKYDWLIFEIIGVCAFYFNMNYFQLLTFVMPFMIYLLIFDFPKQLKELVKKLVILFACWFIGYASLMVLKWFVYAVVIDHNIFNQMINHIFSRTSTNQGARLIGVEKNIITGFGNVWWDIIEIIFILFNIVKIINKKINIKLEDNISELILLVIMIMMPICRCLIFANHVIIHHWFTYRLFMIPVLAFNIILIRMEEKNELVKD